MPLAGEDANRTGSHRGGRRSPAGEEEAAARTCRMAAQAPARLITGKDLDKHSAIGRNTLPRRHAGALLLMRLPPVISMIRLSVCCIERHASEHKYPYRLFDIVRHNLRFRSMPYHPTPVSTAFHAADALVETSSRSAIRRSSQIIPA